MLRPTTRSPVLVHNPDDAEWFGQDRLLPDLERVEPLDQRPRARSSSCRPTPCPPGWPSSTPPTSTRSRSRTAPSPPSCSPPPTCGSSSPRPRATPTRCRGTSCARPRSARAAVAIVLDRTPRRGRRHRRRPTSPGCWPAAASRTRRCSSSHEGQVSDDGLLPLEAGGRDPGLAGRAGRRRRGPRRGGPADPRRRDPHARPGVPTTSPTPPPSRSPPSAGCARTPTRPTTGAIADGRRGVGRRHPAARRGAGPLAGVRRHRRAAPVAGDPRRLAARPGGQRRQGQAAAGRAGDRGGRVRARDADPRARRGRRRAGRGVLAVAGAGPGAAGRRRRGPRPRVPRLAPPGRARGPRLAAGRARDGPHRGRRQARAPRASWPSASTACRWR